jgi:hypothetical protein
MVRAVLITVAAAEVAVAAEADAAETVAAAPTEAAPILAMPTCQDATAKFTVGITTETRPETSRGTTFATRRIAAEVSIHFRIECC